jgi:hypothetical protein
VNVEEASERLEKATFGATRRAALTALVGGALLLGVAPEGEAAKKAKRRKARRRREPWSLRALEVTISNRLSDVPVALESGYFHQIGLPELCCSGQGNTTIPPRGQVTFRAPKPDWDIDINSWVWIGNKYWFTFVNPRLQTPKIGIALNGMLDYGDLRYCCLRRPWGQTVEYERDFPKNRQYAWNIEGRAQFTAIRLPDSKTHIRFTVTVPRSLPTDIVDAE